MVQLDIFLWSEKDMLNFKPLGYLCNNYIAINLLSDLFKEHHHLGHQQKDVGIKLYVDYSITMNVLTYVSALA